MYNTLVRSAGSRFRSWRDGDGTAPEAVQARGETVQVLRKVTSLFASELRGAKWEKLIIAERLMRGHVDELERQGQRGVASCHCVGAPLDGSDAADVAFVRVALHYLRYATAAYLKQGIITFGLVQEDVPLPWTRAHARARGSSSARTMDEDATAASGNGSEWISYHTRVAAECIHCVSLPDSEDGTAQLQAFEFPVFFVATDHATRSVVLAIRGSFSAADAVIDLAATDPRGEQPVVSFPSDDDSDAGVELALHYGFLSAARNVLARATPLLSQLLHEESRNGYDLAVVGHSLGSAAATVVAMLLLAEQRGDPASWAEKFPPTMRIDAWGYGSPPVVGTPERVPRYIHERVHSFIFQSDWVQALSRGSVNEYVRRLVRTARSRTVSELWRAVAARQGSIAERAIAALAHDGALSWAAARVADVGGFWSGVVSDALAHSDDLDMNPSPTTPSGSCTDVAKLKSIEADFAERRAMVRAQLTSGALTQMEHDLICIALDRAMASEVAFRDGDDGDGGQGVRVASETAAGGGGGEEEEEEDRKGRGGGVADAVASAAAADCAADVESAAAGGLEPVVGERAAATLPPSQTKATRATRLHEPAWWACRARSAVTFPPPSPLVQGGSVPPPPPPRVCEDALLDGDALVQSMFTHSECEAQKQYHVGAVYHLASLGAPHVGPRAEAPDECASCAASPSFLSGYSHAHCPQCGCRVCSACVESLHEVTMVPVGCLAPAPVCRLCVERRKAERARGCVRSALSVQRCSTLHFGTFAPSSTSFAAHVPRSYEQYFSTLLLDWGEGGKEDEDGAARSGCGLAEPRATASTASAAKWIAAVLTK